MKVIMKNTSVFPFCCHPCPHTLLKVQREPIESPKGKKTLVTKATKHPINAPPINQINTNYTFGLEFGRYPVGSCNQMLIICLFVNRWCVVFRFIIFFSLCCSFNYYFWFSFDLIINHYLIGILFINMIIASS